MENRKRLVACARGEQPFDLLVRNVHLINVLSGEIYPADIGITGNRVALLAAPGEAQGGAVTEMDGTGLWAAPGFIDGHVHNESSMCTPARWCEVILPHGTTTVCTDPHEIANVLGMRGVQYMLDASRGLPVRYFITVPSCVPAVPHLESAGAVLTDVEVAEMLRWERVVGVAEAMDFVGLANQLGNITPIVEAGQRAHVPIEGHAPGVSGRLLQAYLAAAGPRSSDHESLDAANMLEKVRNGMLVYARVSSFADFTPDLVSAMRSLPDQRMFGFCTDDDMPNHILNNGHLDFGMRRVIAAGIDPVTVIQMATINNAQHYGLWGLGAIAPGWLADLVLLDDLHNLHVRHVITDGILRVRDGQLVQPIAEPVPPLVDNTVHLPAGINLDSFIPLASAAEQAAGEGIYTAMNMASPLGTYFEKVTLPVKDGRVQFPLPQGISLAAVVSRHGQATPLSLAFVTGYPIQSGALASTVSHDSHNLGVIGKNPADILLAVKTLAECGGGLVAVKDGQVLSLVPLPIAGLMSPLPTAAVGQQVSDFEASLPALGLPPVFPITLLAMALPVIPTARLTNLGIVDVLSQQFVPFYSSQA